MADKAVDEWMAFDVGAYTGNTLHLNRAQHGSYLHLILAAFKNAGWLPNDDGLLAQIAKCTPKEWKAERGIYARFFIVTDERWTHEKVTTEWEKAQSLTRQRSKGGSKGAAKRWVGHTKANGKAIAEPSDSHRQNDGHLHSHLQSPVTTSHTVGESARPRATLITEDWIPAEATVKELRLGRPDLVGEHYDAELREFQLWCRANAVTTHDPEASFLRFMRKAKVPGQPQRKSFAQQREEAASNVAEEPWPQRVSGFRRNGFWQPNNWGPPPGQPGCRVPALMLTEETRQ